MNDLAKFLPITDDASLDQAKTEFNRLLAKGFLDLTTDEDARLKTLANAVWDYRASHAEEDEPGAVHGTPRLTVVFHRLPPPDSNLWRAHLSDAVHVGGCGKTPDEAIGWMLLSHPQRFGVGNFRWSDPAPIMPHPEVGSYPDGKQKDFKV